jgi:hypothetical protein
MAEQCPVCGSTAPPPGHSLYTHVYNCPRCGLWGLTLVHSGLTMMLTTKLGDWDEKSVHLRSHLSHIIRRQQRDDGGWVQVPLELESWHLELALPSPKEQLDRLIIAIGDNQPSGAESARVSADALSAFIGTKITRQSPNAGLGWLLTQQETQGLLDNRGEDRGAALLRLKMEGWQRYEALKRAQVESRTALMAMQFGDAELDRVVTDCFAPATKRAGFDLRLLTERQPAGLIDDQLRVALRTSRFVVADLTHGNNGAYWESGFAEGLGRHVIYTCRKKEWDEKKTHFDTNHLVTIIWDASDLASAAERLTATVRATLPAEAKMTDG